MQSVRWHPKEASVLATGSFDKSIALIDCLRSETEIVRFATSGKETIAPHRAFSADVESMQWNPFNEHELFVSLENGFVVCYDRRQTKGFRYAFQAHEKTASSLCFSSVVPGMLVTASLDKTVKIWDTEGESVPACIAYKTMGVGKLLAVDYHPLSAHMQQAGDEALGFLMACGGDGNDGAPAVWFSNELPQIEQRFASRVVRPSL